VTTDTGYILVTGSRHCPSWLWEEVHKQLQDLLRQARGEHGVREIELVQGEAPGVDTAAHVWAVKRQFSAVRSVGFEATWEAECRPGRCKPEHRRKRPDGSDFCPAQGIYRNGRMVDYVAGQYHEHGAWAVVAAFYKTSYSRGTANCVLQARTAGLPVLEFGNAPEAETEEPGETLPGLRA
jgi:hypothetical protein